MYYGKNLNDTPGVSLEDPRAQNFGRFLNFLEDPRVFFRKHCYVIFSKLLKFLTKFLAI